MGHRRNSLSLNKIAHSTKGGGWVEPKTRLRWPCQLIPIALLALLASASAPAQQSPLPLERLRQLVAENPRDARLRVDLGNALDDAGDSIGAIAQYRESILLDPRYPPAYRNLALAYMRQGQWQAAETAARDAIRLDPRYVLPRCDLAVILANRREHDAAARAWRDALDLDRDAVARYTRLDRTELERSEFARLSPDAASHLLLAITLRDLGERPRAVTALQRAASLDSASALPHALLFPLLLEARKTREAEAAYAEAVARNPEWKAVLVNAMSTPSARTAPSAESPEFAALRQMIPGLINVLRMRTATPEQREKARGLLEQAARRLDAALLQTPEYAEGYILLGEALRELGDVPRALRAFDRALRRAANDSGVAARAWLGIGRTYAQSGRERDALDAFAAGLRAVPAEPDLLNDAAWIYATSSEPKLRDPALALNWAQQAVESSRGRNPVYLRTLAEAQFAAGLPADAARSLRRALDQAPDDLLLRQRLREIEEAARKK